MPNLSPIPKPILNSPQYNLNFTHNPSLKMVPDVFDWRTEKPGSVTPVYNQGSCGSCWAFSATENHESRWALQHKTDVTQLSPQQILDCDNHEYGCNGGWPYQAWEYLQQQGGQDTWACYQYEGTVQKCSYKPACNAATITGWGWVSRSDEYGMQAWMVDNAPLSICLDASQWQFYKSGILLSEGCETDTDHCLLLTGWNMLTKPPSWNVRNSWGVSWGELGYIQLQYGKNTCGMAKYPASCNT